MLRQRLRMHRAEAAAASVGILLVLVVAVVLRAGRAPNSHHPMQRPAVGATGAAARLSSADTAPGAGAVEAATNYLRALGNAAVADPASARLVAASSATGPLRGRLVYALPSLAAAMRTRLKHSRAPMLFAGWPLGYRLLAFDRSAATVSLWHLDIASSSALGLLSVDYGTTTYRLRFISGKWRIDGVKTSPGPTPPRPRATRGDLDAFARTASAFSSYRYVP